MSGVVATEAAMSRNGKTGSLAALTLALSLSAGAVSAETSTRVYPPVFDRPPASEKPALTVDEQSKLRDALAKARDHNSQVKTKDATPAPKSKTPR